MGLPAGWVTSVPGLSGNDHLKMLGNGVVPQQAYEAITWLVPGLPEATLRWLQAGARL